MTARRRRLWLASVAAFCAIFASAYFWWWKPVVLSSIRMALEGALAKSLPQASFGSLDMSGIQTVVVRDLSYGKPQDDFSLVVPEARFTFSFWNLAMGRLDPVSSLKSVLLVNPQVILTLEAMGTTEKKGVTKAPDYLAIPLPAQAQVGMKNGRILMRSRMEKSRFVSLSDMDAQAIIPGPGTAIFDSRFTSPDSPKRGVSIQGVLSQSGLSATLSLKKLRLTPLAPWIRRFNPPVAPDMGALSCSLTFSATRTADGRWNISKATGKVETDGMALSGPALPFRLRDITGTARLDGNSLRITALSLLAPETKWNVSGSIDNFTRPVLHVSAKSAAFDPAQYLKGAKGHGTLTIAAEGPATNPDLIITPDIMDFQHESFSGKRLRGKFILEDHGKRIKMDPGEVTMGTGIISAWGIIEPGSPAATLRWTFTPAGTEISAWAGAGSLAKGVVNLSAKSVDGIWVITGRSRREDGAWNTSLAAHSDSGGLISATVRAGAKAPFRLTGYVSIQDTSLTDFHLDQAWETLKRIQGRLDGSGQLSGNASNPVLSLELNGKELKLDGEKLFLTGSVKISPTAARIDPLKFGQYARLSVLIPFENNPILIAGNATGLPIPLALAIAGVPSNTRKNIAGTIQGSFSGENPGSKEGIVRANLELADISWNGTRLGTGVLTGRGKGSIFNFTKVGLNGPIASAAGTGSLELLDNGDWNVGSSLTVNYLKQGQTDLECLTKLTASGRAGARTIGAQLSSVRLSGSPYPDAEISLMLSSDGSSSAKFSWEDLAYISASIKESPEKTLALTAALSDFPVSPLAGLFSQPAPADRVSGSISLKGRQDHSAISASLKWGHGEADARGWIDLVSGRNFSLSLNAVDGKLGPWVSLLRSASPYKNIPDLDGRLETKGMTMDRSGDSMSVNGWLGARELRVGGVLCGNGNLRVTSSGGQAELEASIEGPQGKYTLYPTRITRTGERSTMEGAFSWSKVPMAKTECSLSRGELKAAWTQNSASANLAFTGLGLEDRALEKIFIRLERTGNKWRVSSPKESPWQVIGKVTLAGTRVSVEEDERTGGSYLLVRGGDGTSIKAGGTWAPPATPEEFSFEAHRLPAAPLFSALGMPPTEGIAEADLDWKAARETPLSGRLTLLDARWGGFLFDSIDMRISGTPGRSFTMTSLRLVQGTDLSAKGTGELILFPEQSVKLAVTVDKLVLRYLKPLGILDDSDSSASGKITVSGTPDEPQLEGTLTCTPGTVKPRTGFSSLYLSEGKLDFAGSRATLSAVLNDITGASVVVNGTAEMKKLVPASFTLALTAPQPVKIDALPGLFKGSARGTVRFEGTPESPLLRGEVTLENGQLRNPPSQKKGGKDSLTDKMSWDMEVGFGKNVQYVIGAPLGGQIELAQLSARSHITIKGKGSDFKVAGEVLADSGPLTLFLGQRLWKN